ncbi:MAG: CAP domain-containing protein, partial [Planctomycetota bacterium]|nr:CAP domain-containing protein [Planctomycetota bacterium]
MFACWPFQSGGFLRRMFPRWRRATPTPKRRQSARANSTSAESLEPRQLLTVVSLTDHEQLLLEMINRARANPQAEAARYGIDLNNGLSGSTISTSAKPPLAPNQSLVNAARGHSMDMLTDGFFDHSNPNTGSTPSLRAAAAGYSPILNIAENVAWNGTSNAIDPLESTLLNHQNLFLSPGHRINMLSTSYREIGVGNLFGEFRNFNAGMVTEKFGNRGGNSFITGVVFTDTVVSDNFFSVGEAVPGVTVTITGSGINVSEQTGTSGAYSIAVPNGTYTVRLSGANIATQGIPNVVVSNANRKVDFEAADGAISAVLTLQVAPVSFAENAGAGAATGTVTRTGNLSQALTVTLVSNDTTEATVPTNVTIAAGQASNTFSINAIDDNLADGTRTVILTASATGFSNVTSTISVTDFETFSPTAPLGPIFAARPTFQWPAVAGAARYEVWLKNVTTNKAPVVRNTQITSTSFTSPKDLDAADYRFWVRPYDVDGVRGEWSTAANFTVKAGPALKSPSEGTIQDARPVFRWNSVDTAVRYQLWVNHVATGQTAVIRETQIQSTQFRPSGLLASGHYRVWVRGYDAEGQRSAWSERLDFTIGPSITGPSGLQDTVAPRISWTGVEGTVRYDFWANNLTTGVRQVIREPLLTATSFTPSSALPAGRYRIWVRAFGSET